MSLQELAAITLTATITAGIVAPLTMLALRHFGVADDFRAPIVAAVTAAITTTMVARTQRRFAA